MRIGLNATCFDTVPSGANRRFQTLFPEIVGRMPDVEFLIYEPANHDVAARFRNFPNVRIVPTPLRAGSRLQKARAGLSWWPRRLRADRLDIFDCFNLPAFANPRGATFLTVHDIRRTLLPRLHPARIAYDLAMGAALRRADHLIAVSQTARREIEAAYAPPGISVIHNGVDAGRFEAAAPGDWAALRQRLCLPERILLAVGHLEPRKNYPVLIEAIAQLGQRGEDVFLLIAGRDHGQKAALQARIEALGIGGRVRLESAVSDAELACLYRNCAAVVFPSLYEGFGIPAIEAMAAGAPIALSEIAVFREISPGCGLFFDPGSARAIADAIATILGDPERAARIAAYGRIRARDFAPASLAGHYEDLYRRFLPGRG